MLSRVADNIIWLSRYVERASNTARFLEVSYNLNLDLQQTHLEQWTPLIEITGDMELFTKLYGEPTSENVMRFLMYDLKYPNSIASCLKAARENAKGLREALPSEMFEEINALGKIIPLAAEENDILHSTVYDLCTRVKRASIMISGVISETIERGTGYNFWRLGESMERADKTSRLLHVKYFYLLPKITDVGTIIEDMQWTALLISLDARESYHRTHGLIERDNVLHMIVLNPLFPRSILFCLQTALLSLNRITDQRGLPHEMLEKLCADLANLEAKDIIKQGMNEFIDELQTSMNDINSAIFEHFNVTINLPAGA